VRLPAFTNRLASRSGRGSGSTTGSPDDELRAVCERLSDEIAVNRRILERDRLLLAKLQARGVKHRGLLAGLLAGGAIVLTALFALIAFLCLAFSALRTMSLGPMGK
jgi:hypothetical protein